jgi:hypothetical protein
VEDVLLTRGELVAGSKDSLFAACEAPAACIVSGVSPGAIDSVSGLTAEQPATTAYGFRCVWRQGT